MSIMMKSLHIEEAAAPRTLVTSTASTRRNIPSGSLNTGGINAKSASVSWSLGHFRVFA
jgi:hypothetical protein